MVSGRTREEMNRAHERKRKYHNTPQSLEVGRIEAQNVSRSQRRFALLRAFRGAGIFGSETRNEIVRLQTWNEIAKRLGEKKFKIFQRAYYDSLSAAKKAENSVFVQGEEERIVGKKEEKLIQGKFGIRRKAA